MEAVASSLGDPCREAPDATLADCVGALPKDLVLCSSCRRLEFLCSDDPDACPLGPDGALLVDCTEECSGCPAVADDEPGPTAAFYSRFPYKEGNPGYVRREPLSDNGNPGLAAGRFRLEGGYGGAGVGRVSAEVLLQLWRIGFANDLTLFAEPAARDTILVGNFAVPFSIVMRPHVLWSAGPGLTYVIDPRRPRSTGQGVPLGPIGTTRLDIFIVKPVVLSGRFDGGTLFDDDRFGPSSRALMLTARGQVGFLLKRWEIYAGYAYKGMGRLSLRGPVGGVRVWF